MSKRPAEEEAGLLSPSQSQGPAKKAKKAEEEPEVVPAGAGADKGNDAGDGDGAKPASGEEGDAGEEADKGNDADGDGEDEKLEMDAVEDNERNSAILRQLEKMHPDQMERYEAYRRSTFQKSNMKRLLSSIAGSGINVSPQLTIVMSGIAKMFVGDLVETSRQVMSEGGEEGQIRPSHVREAVARLVKAKRMGTKHNRPRMFL